MAGEQATYLEGRVNMLDVQLKHIDAKVDVVLSKMDKQSEMIDQMRLGQAERADQMSMFQQKLEELEGHGQQRIEWGKRKVDEVEREMASLRANCLGHAERSQDELIWTGTLAKAKMGATIAFCAFVMIASVYGMNLFLNRGMVHAEHQLIEHAAP